MSLTMPLEPFMMTSRQDVDLFPTVSELTVAQAAKVIDGTEGCVNELPHDEPIEIPVYKRVQFKLGKPEKVVLY